MSNCARPADLLTALHLVLRTAEDLLGRRLADYDPLPEGFSGGIGADRQSARKSSVPHDEYCSSSPMLLNGWSAFLMSSVEPKLNRKSLNLPSHNTPAR